MSDFVDQLEQDLVAAARRLAERQGPPEPPRWRRPPARGLLLAAALLVLTAGSAAAGTLLALRGSVIPAPVAVPPEQTPAPGTGRVSALRAADPDPGVPPWTLRVARSETGLLCSTVGLLLDGRFGLVGLDRRFRVLDEGVSDSCGAERHGAASLIGARVFDARQRQAVRTVVSGVAGEELRRVDLDAGGRVRALAVGVDGTFIAALRGYPEDLAIRVTLRFASGRREVHDLGRSATVVPDPEGGGAWRAWAFSLSGGSPSCVDFRPARPTRAPAVSPGACGHLGGWVRRRTGVYFAVRRITPGTGGTPTIEGEGHWGAHPARTAVWGEAGDDVAAVSVQQPGAPPRGVTLGPGSRTFLAVFAGAVRPGSLTVRVRFRDGRLLVAHRSTGLVPQPVVPPHHPRSTP